MFRMRKITFQTDYNQNSLIFSVDHNDIFDHRYCIDPGNFLASKTPIPLDGDSVTIRNVGKNDTNCNRNGKSAVEAPRP